jgi:hypothetical protein
LGAKNTTPVAAASFFSTFFCRKQQPQSQRCYFFLFLLQVCPLPELADFGRRRDEILSPGADEADGEVVATVTKRRDMNKFKIHKVRKKSLWNASKPMHRNFIFRSFGHFISYSPPPP